MIVDELNRINESNENLNYIRIYIKEDSVYVHRNTDNKEVEAVLNLDTKKTISWSPDTDNGFIGIKAYYQVGDIVFKIFLADGTTLNFVET